MGKPFRQPVLFALGIDARIPQQLVVIVPHVQFNYRGAAGNCRHEAALPGFYGVDFRQHCRVIGQLELAFEQVDQPDGRKMRGQ